MNRFVARVVVYIILLGGLNYAWTQLLPEGWENPRQYAKLTQYKAGPHDHINTLMFGSSRTLRHIDPVLFDSLNATKGIKTDSYNLATSGVYFNEERYLLDNLYKEVMAAPALRYVLLELDDNIFIKEEDLFTTKTSYYIKTQSLLHMLAQIRVSHAPRQTKVKQSVYFVASLIRHHMRLGLGRTVLESMLYSRVSGHRSKNHGYSSLDVNMPAYKVNRNYQERHQRLLDDTTQIRRQFARIQQAQRQAEIESYYNPLVFDFYADFIRQMGKRGVHVYCIIPIRSSVSPGLLSLYRALPEANRINMIDHPGIEKLFSPGYWFDPGHLQKAGSRIYTGFVSDEFAAKQQGQ